MTEPFHLLVRLARTPPFKSMMDKAISDKASLVDVEELLIAKMRDCIAQLNDELAESNGRFATMKDVRSEPCPPTTRPKQTELSEEKQRRIAAQSPAMGKASAMVAHVKNITSC